MKALLILLLFFVSTIALARKHSETVFSTERDGLKQDQLSEVVRLSVDFAILRDNRNGEPICLISAANDSSLVPGKFFRSSNKNSEEMRNSIFSQIPECDSLQTQTIRSFAKYGAMKKETEVAGANVVLPAIACALGAGVSRLDEDYMVRSLLDIDSFSDEVFNTAKDSAFPGFVLALGWEAALVLDNPIIDNTARSMKQIFKLTGVSAACGLGVEILEHAHENNFNLGLMSDSFVQYIFNGVENFKEIFNSDDQEERPSTPYDLGFPAIL